MRLKAQLVTLESPIWVPVQVAASHPIQLSANAHAKAEKDGPSTWASVPLMENLNI